jgi:hypothetical protein
MLRALHQLTSQLICVILCVRPSASYWWKSFALVQRIVLICWPRLMDSELKFMRLMIAILVTRGFLVALRVSQPYRRKLDQTMAAGLQIVFVCIVLCGVVVLLYEAIEAHAGAPPGLASELLGIRSSEEAVVMMMCVALTFAATSYVHVQQKRLRSKWAVCTLDPPQVKRWPHRGIYACVLSYYKMEAASEASYMHERRQMQAFEPPNLERFSSPRAK